MSANPPAGMTARHLRTLVAALPLLTVGACDWFSDFKNQPKLEPWEPPSQDVADTTHAPRGQPQYSVPVTGVGVAAYQVSYGALPGVVDSVARLVTNPTPVSANSLSNGRKHYQINCAVCHGDAGAGNGPATRGYGIPQINLLTETTRGRTDGYIYAMLRNGRGLMPTYNRIEELDRWDVVNYVRALQGQTANTAGVGPVGYPGQNGETVPGYSATAPTRPAPFWRPAAGPAGERPPIVTARQAGEAGTAPAAAGEAPAPNAPATSPTAPAPSAAPSPAPGAGQTAPTNAGARP